MREAKKIGKLILGGLIGAVILSSCTTNQKVIRQSNLVPAPYANKGKHEVIEVKAPPVMGKRSVTTLLFQKIYLQNYLIGPPEKHLG